MYIILNMTHYVVIFINILKVSHPSIITEKEYTLGPYEKGKFQAWFEPTELGVQYCNVSFNSPIAGEFVLV